MLSDRVTNLLNAFFNHPLVEYAEVIREIREGGGLTAAEVEAIESQVGCLDARMLIRHAGAASTWQTVAYQRPEDKSDRGEFSQSFDAHH